MAEVRFNVVQAGPHVSVQDAGRFGMLRYGVPASGPMDRLAHQAANLALGNLATAAAIEISLGGLVLDCVAGQGMLAVAGGGFVVTVDDHRYGSWSVFPVRAGSRVTIRPGPWGSWAYLAISAMLETKTWAGSAATHALSGLGGGKLSAGDVLIGAASRVPSAAAPLPCPVLARPRAHLRVVLGPQDRFFAPETIDTFLGATFTLTDAYDRMGVRLRGPALMPNAALTMPSEPILRGSVQVAGDGVATVLLADHQTTGGYPKIATLLSCDLDGFAQLRPRAPVAFQAVTPAQALQISRHHATATARYLAGISRRTAAI